MRHFSERIERIDGLLQTDPVAGFELARDLLDPPPSDPCDHGRSLDGYGSACRVFGDLNRAEASYEKADEICQCEACLWDRLRRRTYLRTEQGLFLEAEELAASAIDCAPSRALVGRCRVAAAYVPHVARKEVVAIETARWALEELDRADLLYATGAVTIIGICANRMDQAPEDLLCQSREALRDLRRRWPRSQRYRSARGKVSIVSTLLGYRLGEVDPCELRETLARVQRLHVSLGMWRDAVQITAESAEICAGMQREDLVARMILAMLDLLPKSLPRHVATALHRLKRSLEAIDRSEILRAAADVQEAIVLRPSPVL